MGTILQERQCPERLSIIREREWKRKASWSNNNRPNVASSNTMGRRQSQRKLQAPQCSLPSQENNNEKRLQQRRKHKSNTPPTKCNSSQHNAQGSSESKSHALSPDEDRVEPVKVQPPREHKHTAALRGRGHTTASHCHQSLSGSTPDLLDKPPPPHPDTAALSGHGEGDSDTDLSESERLPASPSVRVPPQLELRPEVIDAEDCCSHRPRGRARRGFDFPDSLPPPFNSWSLAQLAVFYNTEGRGAPRPRPVGPLERYMDGLLKLEWRQIQTVQEESGGKTGLSEGPMSTSCHRAPAAAAAAAAGASARLSSPKCILQCQRSFPLTFLSSLASHSALLSGCACTLCRIRYSAFSSSCCRLGRQSRQSPTPEDGRASLPKRSYSESRVQPSSSSDRTGLRTGSAPSPRAPRSGSPARANGHLRRMQATGNIRIPLQEGANTKSTTKSTARDSSVGAAGSSQPLGARRDMMDTYYRTGEFRMQRRSGSEQSRGGAERHRGASEKRRSGSECRRGGGAERLRDKDIKPEAVTAIMDNLPGSKNGSVKRPNRPKQVEFVT